MATDFSPGTIQTELSNRESCHTRMETMNLGPFRLARSDAELEPELILVIEDVEINLVFQPEWFQAIFPS